MLRIQYANGIMTDTRDGDEQVPRWLHWWAVLTVCAALPLVLLGAEVTTRQVGLVDPQGFRAPWHLLTAPLRERGLGYVIEHSHRLAGFTVGTCSIVLALGLWWTARRRLLRWLGCAALAAVSAQGVLGIFRVNLLRFEPYLALVHGCFAQLVFALLVSIAVLTSRAWGRPVAASRERTNLRRLALGVSMLVYVQIVFGAFVRHLQDRVAQRFHVLLAFVAAATAAWLVKGIWERLGTDRPARRTAAVLAVLVALQVMLGVETWIRRFGSGVPVEWQTPSAATDMVRSTHFLVGALVFTTTVVLALFLSRPGVAAVAYPALPAKPMEGAA